MVRIHRLTQLAVAGTMAVVFAFASMVQVTAQRKSEDPKKGTPPRAIQSIQIVKVSGDQIILSVDGQIIGPVHFVYRNAGENTDKQPKK